MSIEWESNENAKRTSIMASAYRPLPALHPMVFLVNLKSTIRNLEGC